MALTDLLASLEHDARARLAEARAAAEAEAARLRAEAAETAARRRAEVTATTRASLAQESGHAVALATQRVQHAVLASRERAAQRVLSTARAQCREPPPPELHATLVALAQAGLRYLERGRAIARGDPALLTALGTAVNGTHDLTLTPDPSVGAGLHLASADGRTCVDASLLGRLAHREDEARAYLVRRLAEGVS